MPPLDRAATMQTAQRSEEKPGHQDPAETTSVGDSPTEGGLRKTFAVPVVPVPGVA